MQPNTKDVAPQAAVKSNKKKSGLKRYLSMLGPGLISGASDDDPSGIVTYAQAGAQFGLAPLWTALFTFPLISSVQYICAKISLVTGLTLSGVMRRHYPPWLLYTAITLLIIANTINAGADIGAIASGICLVFPAVPPQVLPLPITLAILGVFIFASYKFLVKVFRWLTLALFAFVASSLMSHPDWQKVFLFTFIPHIEWSAEYLSVFVAILGTTISPYLFFWQTQEEVAEMEKGGNNAPTGKKGDLKLAAVDVSAGMFLSNVVMFFVILASANTLHAQGITQVTSATQAAQALKPLGGNIATWLFAAGLIGTGVLAVPILIGSSAHALATAFGWKRGLDQKWYQAAPYYSVMVIAALIGMGLNYFNLNPIKMLYWAAILNGVLAPPMLFVIMFISNSKRIMGDKTNSKVTNILGWTTTCMMTAAAIAVITSTIKSWPNVH